MEPPGSVLGALPRALGTAVRMVVGTLWVLLATVLPALALGPAGTFVGTLTFCGALLVVHSFVRNRKFAVRELGYRRILEEKRLGPDTEESCDACGGPAGGGLVRRYARQFALLGSAVYTAEWGGNVYCRDCEAAADLNAGTGTVPVQGTDRRSDRDPAAEPGRVTTTADAPDPTGPRPEPAAEPVEPTTVEVERAD